MNYLEEIKKELKEKGAKVGEISKETKFDSLGLDSLDIMDMIVSLEEKTGATFSDEMLMEIKTVGDLILKLNELVGEKK